MSFQATIDMFVNFSYIQVRFLNRQGYLRYRINIYMKLQGSEATCHPYNIVKGPTRSQPEIPSQYQEKIQSEIDADTLHYYSRLIPVVYRPGNYQQNQTVFFKAYVNTQVIDDIQFYCLIECLFTEDTKKPLQVVGKFEARIRKIFDVSTFLPVVFDAFQGFMIFSTFHSTILEFKHNQNDFEAIKNKKAIQIQKKCPDFYSYLQIVTNKFQRQQVLKFYQYYRQFLQKQHQAIQNRHEQLINKLIKEAKSKLQQSALEKNTISYVKIMRNNQLLKLLVGRSVYEPFNQPPPPFKIQQREKITEMIAKDLAQVKGHLYKKWMQFAKFVINFSKIIAKFYRKQYQSLCKQRFKNNVFSHKVKSYDWKLSKYEDSGKVNLQQAFSEKKKGNSQQELWKEHFPIQNIEYFGRSQTNVKIFEQIYPTNSKIGQIQAKNRHVIILVHGFQASRQDFILLKNCLQVVYGVQVIISTCNQGLTQSSIVAAGKRLAAEIRKVLSNQIGQYRLSFIGHSMGGLIIRSAIPEMQQSIRKRFYTFMTFSTPHLGYLYQSSAIIKAGLWILNAWHKIQALQQISMKDNKNPRQTVLYNLSKNGSLKQFKKICFVCSSLDQYVVYQSARVQQNEKLMQQTLAEETQKVIRQMVEGILGEVVSPEISRINVVFNIQDKNIDSFLGRTGHIKFLSDIQFIREFCSCFDKFFI